MKNDCPWSLKSAYHDLSHKSRRVGLGMMKAQRISTAVAAIALLLGASACGDSDVEPGSGETAAPESSVEPSATSGSVASSGPGESLEPTPSDAETAAPSATTHRTASPSNKPSADGQPASIAVPCPEPVDGHGLVVLAGEISCGEASQQMKEYLAAPVGGNGNANNQQINGYDCSMPTSAASAQRGYSAGCVTRDQGRAIALTRGEAVKPHEGVRVDAASYKAERGMYRFAAQTGPAQCVVFTSEEVISGMPTAVHCIGQPTQVDGETHTSATLTSDQSQTQWEPSMPGAPQIFAEDSPTLAPGEVLVLGEFSCTSERPDQLRCGTNTHWVGVSGRKVDAQ